MRILVLSGEGPARGAARVAATRGAPEGAARAGLLADALRALGHEVAVAGATPRVLRLRPDAVVTTGPLPGPHPLGALLRRGGATWIVDAGHGLGGGRLEGRVVRAADLVLCATPEVLDDVHRRIGASLGLAPDDAPAPPGGVVDVQLRAHERLRAPGTPARRVLMLGPVNSPHLEHLALAMHERGLNVLAAGEEWPELPPSVLPAAGVPVDTATFPLVLWLRRVLTTFRPDVVHAHWLPFAFKALAANARPLIAMPWGSDVYRVDGLLAAANRPVARLADAVLADSNDLIDAMVALGTPRERASLLNWGVDLERFRPAEPAERGELRERLGLGDGPVVLSPRSLKALYNPRVIVDAFETVAARVPGAQLVLKHMSADPPSDLGDLPASVRIVGHVPYDEMADWYRVADVCVSIPDTDSSPRSVWEAMASGCPCVVSDLPWAHEMLEPGRHALVVAPETAAVAAAIERILTEPELATALATEGRGLVERERDQRAEMDRLVALYDRIANTGRHTPTDVSSPE